MRFEEKTIYAVSTPAGRGAISIIRLSGTKSLHAIEAITKQPPPQARMASVRTLLDPQTADPMDEALVLTFKAPASFTGEDMAELHIHGGPAVCASVLSALAWIDGLVPAEPGDFSRRAVLNGRLDLTRAEGIADMIDAETSAQQTQAFRQMRGALGALYSGWRTHLSAALAHLEADIEFADEDLPGGLGKAVLGDVQRLEAQIAAHLSEPRGRSLRDGIEIAIIGAPNVGKSSLLNSLAGREAAIVSGRAGTTRDIVEVTTSFSGVPVVIADTAGIRAAGDEIEREGVRRARLRADEADIRIFVTAPDVQAEDLDISPQQGDYHVLNKADIDNPSDKLAGMRVDDLLVSAKTGEGIPALLELLEKDVQARFGLADHPVLTRQRHKQALESALICLRRGLAVAAERGTFELVAEDLRQAMRDIGRITGEVDVESLLDIVFRDFCIGK